MRPILLVTLIAAFSLLLARDVAAAEAAPRVAPHASAALKNYVAKVDASYGFTKRREGTLGKGTYVELTLTSQTWRETVWRHQLFIYKPSQIAAGSQALLLIEGGVWSDRLAKPPAADEQQLPSSALLVAAAGESMQSIVAVVLQVPQQPIFNGLVEDAAISYTFSKFFETQNTEWPLLLPMVKSAVRAMDAVQEYARDNWQLEVKNFIVTGASKRGWTTWLTAAVDARVNAFAPMVIDMLNMAPQMKHQRETFGGYSDRIHDYTDKGLQKYLSTPRGTILQSIVDPYSYRALLKQPKLIMLGTNDPYWPVDALNVYWDGLIGDKYILYVPNGAHGLRDYPRMIGTITALHKSLNGGKALPKLDWKFAEHGDGVRLSVTSDQKPESVVAWTASAPTRDFRQARWESNPAAAAGEGGKEWTIDLPQPEKGYAAVFGEARFGDAPMPYYFSTNLRVVPGKDAAKGE